MAIRINLLPEARIQKLKNQQTKRLTALVCGAIVLGVVSTVVVLILLLGARAFQSSQNKNKMSNLQKQIASKADTEQDVAWFNDALSESSRLSNNRILISQLFDRLTEALPQNVKLTELSVDPNYNVKASVQATDFNTVALFTDALSSYNVTNRLIDGFDRKAVFTNIQINSVSNKAASSIAGNQANTKIFDVTFSVDKDLVQKFRNDEQSTGSTTTGTTNGN